MLFRSLAAATLMVLIAPLGAMNDSAAPNLNRLPNHVALTQTPGTVSVLTYNVKGLPWPIATGRVAAFASIEARLTKLRSLGKQPHIVVLQEAFTDRAKEIGARSGYTFRVSGPASTDVPTEQLVSDDPSFAANASALKGETEGKWVDSGLQIFSDYPIVAIHRSPFPASACAGYDCLSNKGVLLVEIQVPGEPVPVTIAATHLNSKKTSGVSDARSLEAFQQQVAYLTQFIGKNRKMASPLVLTGDFNGNSPARIATLKQAFLSVDAKRPETAGKSGMAEFLASHPVSGLLASEAAYITKRGRDWQFVEGGGKIRLRASGLSIPFGKEADGTMLSDHLGFMINYRMINLHKKQGAENAST